LDFYPKVNNEDANLLSSGINKLKPYSDDDCSDDD